jgi:hypothetical protein
MINTWLSGACNLSPGFQFDFYKVDRKWGVTHNVESGPTKDHFSSNFSADDFDMVFFLIICLIAINWLKRDPRTIHN